MMVVFPAKFVLWRMVKHVVSLAEELPVQEHQFRLRAHDVVAPEVAVNQTWSGAFTRNQRHKIGFVFLKYLLLSRSSEVGVLG